MVKILLPYVEEHPTFKKCKFFLEKYTPKEVEIVYIHDKKKQGMTKVMNPYFTGEDDLIIWHSDLMATENWYDELYAEIMTYKPAIIGMKLVYPNNVIQHYGGWIRADGICYHPHQNCLDIGFDCPVEPVFATWGGVYISKEVIKKVGKMDEQFEQMYYGDVDYCLRTRHEGFKVVVVPVKLIHEESLDTKKNRDKLNQLLMKNAQIFQAKYMPILAGALDGKE